MEHLASKIFCQNSEASFASGSRAPTPIIAMGSKASWSVPEDFMQSLTYVIGHHRRTVSGVYVNYLSSDSR